MWVPVHTHCTIYMHIKSLRDRSTSVESLQERDVGLHYNVIVGNAIIIIMLIRVRDEYPPNPTGA